MRIEAEVIVSKRISDVKKRDVDFHACRVAYITLLMESDATVADHQVRCYEVVSAFDDPNGYEVPDPAGHAERWMWVGKAVHERVLVVIYSEEALPLYRLISAFDAAGRWRDVYDQGQGV